MLCAKLGVLTGAMFFSPLMRFNRNSCPFKKYSHHFENFRFFMFDSTLYCEFVFLIILTKSIFYASVKFYYKKSSLVNK